MMGNFSFDKAAMSEYINKLAKLGDAAPKAANKALYAATKIYADELRRKTAALPTQEGLAAKGSMIHVLSKKQKEALLQSIDIYPVKSKKAGMRTMSVGFVGYNSIQTQKYPKGQPNRMIAGSVNSGSSVREKTPFVRQTVKATKPQCIAAMKAAVDTDFNKIIK
jgi:hypothetical protein